MLELSGELHLTVQACFFFLFSLKKVSYFPQNATICFHQIQSITCLSVVTRKTLKESEEEVLRLTVTQMCLHWIVKRCIMNILRSEH